MPRGVKGTGPHSKVAKEKARAEAKLARTRADEVEDELPRVDDGKPRCRVCKAVLAPGGHCASCQKRAVRFKALIEAEAVARQCQACDAPAPQARRGKRLCPLCRKLTLREQKLGLAKGTRT